MVILIIIYIISIIGAILSIRYDQAIFDEDSWTIFLVFCPIVNSGGILEYYTRYWTLNKQKYICDKCLEKISLILSNESNR